MLQTLLAQRTVTDPHGRTWNVGIRWLPRRPRWVGWGPGRRRRQRSKYKEGSWVDGLDGLDIFSADFGDDPRVIPVIIGMAIVVFLAWFILLPIAILALDLLFLLLLAAATVAASVFFRRPWIVEAATADERRHWPVVGWAASKRKVAEVAYGLEHDSDPSR